MAELPNDPFTSYSVGMDGYMDVDSFGEFVYGTEAHKVYTAARRMYDYLCGLRHTVDHVDVLCSTFERLVRRLDDERSEIED